MKPTLLAMYVDKDFANRKEQFSFSTNYGEIRYYRGSLSSLKRFEKLFDSGKYETSFSGNKFGNIMIVSMKRPREEEG